MELFYILLILLVATRTFGEIAIRMGHPALVGELISGIALGLLIRSFPETFSIMKNLGHDEVFNAVTDLAIFFLMLLAGLEMHPRELVESSKGALAVALGGLLLPLATGLGIGYVFLPPSKFLHAQAMFIGTAMAITAVPVTAKVLMDLKILDSPPGKIMVSAAIFDDIMSLILLAVLTALIQTGQIPDPLTLALLAGKVLLFFILTVGIGMYLLPKISKLSQVSLSEEFEFSLLLMVTFGFSVLAEFLGMHFILGAFTAGLFFTRRSMKAELFEGVKNRVSGITTGFLAPIFFASIGLNLDPSAINAIPFFLLLLTVSALVCKLVGAGLPALWVGLSRRDSLMVGIGMSARGAVELIIAGIALKAGLFSQPEAAPPVVSHMFSAIVIMAVVTTVLAPILLKTVSKR
jgi:Kef-type K+ transport system membrane component KefB